VVENVNHAVDAKVSLETTDEKQIIAVKNEFPPVNFAHKFLDKSVKYTSLC
jgi:hypothetical protein